MKRVHALYRVSTVGQVDKNDIPMQKQACREFADSQGWTITKEHFEKGVSGYKVSANDRDAIQDIKAAALAKEFDILLVFMFDRLGRRDDETPFVVEWFVRQGVDVWSTQEGQQRFDSHTDKLTNYIRYWQASGESEKTSIRTKTRLGQIVQEGRFRGGKYPYGYRLEKQGRFNKRGHEVNEIVIDEFESQVVQNIFDWYASKGMGTYEIAMQLTSENIQSRSGSWHATTILHMLENIAYTGVLRSGETYSEPFEDLRIVSDDLFQRACALRKSRSRKTERTVPMSSKSQSLLSGNIFCGHCGGRLTPSRSGKNRLLKDGTMSNTIRYTYVCYNQNRKRKDCDGPCTYTCHIVDDVVIDVIRNLLGKLTDSPKDALMESLGQNKLSESQKQINETKTNLDTAQKILDNVNKEVLASITGESPYSKEQISVVLQEQNNKVAALSERLESLLQLKKNSQKSMAESANMLENIYTWAESFDKVDLQSKKMIAANLVKKIIVHRDYKIQIELNVDIEALALAVGESIPLKIAS